MIALVRYYLLKELKNLPVMLAVILITIGVSFLENVSEITLLVLLMISTGVYSGNEKENRNSEVFQTVIPVSIFDQLKGSYLFLTIRTVICMLIYSLTYLGVNKVIGKILIFQLILFFSTSLSVGAMVILKDFTENQMRKTTYYIVLVLLSIQSLLVDNLNFFFDFKISVEEQIIITMCLNLIICFLIFTYSLAVVKKFRRNKYAALNS